MVSQKLGASAKFSIFSPYFSPNLHFKPCNNHFFSFWVLLCCVYDHIWTHLSVLKVYCPNQTITEGLRCGKNYVRRPNFGYFKKPISTGKWQGSVTIPWRRKFLLLECVHYGHSNKTTERQPRVTLQKIQKSVISPRAKSRKPENRISALKEHDRNVRFHISTYNNSKL